MIKSLKFVLIKLILLTIVIRIHVSIVDADNATNIVDNKTGPITYVSYVEENIGFYKVSDTTAHKESPYKERVLTINQKDTVMWLNDADVAILTIVSEQDLWDKAKSKLKPPNRRFNYTFMVSGTYTVYIDEYKNLAHQTIIVNPIKDYTIETLDIIPRIIIDPTPNQTVHHEPKVTIDPTPNQTILINDTHTLSNNVGSDSGKKNNSDISWLIIFDFINAISNLIFSLSMMIIAYKIWKDY